MAENRGEKLENMCKKGKVYPLMATTWKALRKIKERLLSKAYTPVTKMFFVLNGIECESGLHCCGIPQVYVTRRGKVRIGENFRVNSGSNHNIIGRQGRTIIWSEGAITIGNNVGISNSALICRNEIIIEDDVTIGGNCVVYDTDFHPVNPSARLNDQADIEQAASSPVIIRQNTFIGAHSTILKGVEIGENSVIGACSLVAKSIPPNEIWAGNPAIKIRSIR